MIYNKLVRDKIPEMIVVQGETPVYSVLGDEEYIRCLEAKLDEEVKEFHEEKNIEELSDILEVVYALAEANGHTKEELIAAYREKHEKRGGFSKKIFLISKE